MNTKSRTTAATNKFKNWVVGSRGMSSTDMDMESVSVRCYFSSAVSLISLGVLIASTGCSKGEPEGPGRKTDQDSVQVRREQPAQEQEQYDRSLKASELGKLELFSVKADYFEKRRGDLSARTLQAVKLDSDYNTEAYLLDGYEIPGAVIARPKVLIRSSVTGQRVRLKDGQDGQVVVEVSVALVDGMVSELFTGKGKRPVPEEFLVKNREGFLAELETKLKQKPAFLSNVRCPADLKFRVEALGEFGVDFKSKLKNCPINTFFPAEMRLKVNEWQGVVLAFAQGRHVEIEANLNLSLPITVSYGKFALNKKAVREALKVNLKEMKEPYSVEEITTAERALTNTLETSFAASFAPDLYLPELDEIIRDTLTMRFGAECQAQASPCFFWKEIPAWTSALEYQFELRREEFVGRPLLLTTRSPVSDYLSDHQEFMLKAAPENPLEPPKTSEISQLFRTVQEGEIAELQVRHLELGELTLAEPKIERISNKVCIEPYSLCTEGRWRCTNPNTENYNCRNVCTGGHDHVCSQGRSVCNDGYGAPCGVTCYPGDCHHECTKWDDPCKGWTQVCDQRRVCDRLTAPAAPKLPFRTDKNNPTANDFAWDCTKLAQNQCDPDKWADHWQRVVTWAYPVTTPRALEQQWKREYWDQAIAGLGVKFSWATETGTETATCPVGSLEHQVIGKDRLLIVLRNTPDCHAFNALNRKVGYGPSISLTNQIVFPSEFQCGSITENWEGKRRYLCRVGEKPELSQETTVADDERRLSRGERLGIYQPYYPRVELQGRLRIVGSYFESGGESL